jgi:hypothetical protein
MENTADISFSELVSKQELNQYENDDGMRSHSASND